ncbi:hypothetical protein [Streptomyces wuyuanensis]|uniref:hypothetical protein n=1 Tax=Streptomyces wuyuanensis TaxID=1196353 RepID=UPI003D730C71
MGTVAGFGCSPWRLEEVDGGQTGFAVDELEGHFGPGREVEGVESFDVGGVNDGIQAGAQKRCGCPE